MKLWAPLAKPRERALALVCLGVLALLVSRCGTDIQSGIDTANDLIYNTQYVSAERLYEKLLKRIEESGPRLDDEEEQERLLVLDRLGKLNALYLHDYDAAVKYYQALVKLYPRSDQALGFSGGSVVQFRRPRRYCRRDRCGPVR